MTASFDAIVIGAGSGGLTAAIGLARLGRKVGLVERGNVGGDCTNVGCIPSKALIHLSAHHAGSAGTEDLLERVRRLRDHLRQEETTLVSETPNLTLLPGHARFSGRRELMVTAPDGSRTRLSARDIVIATGSSPVRFPVPGAREERLLTNESLFELEEAPEHLAVVGGGAIGVEMAFAWRRLGSRVTLVEGARRILPALEPRVGELIAARLAEAGISLVTGAFARSYHEESRSLELERDGASARVPEVDKILLAVGRRPNIDLDLDATGVEATPAGIIIDSAGRTTEPHIYAVGDVTTSSASTHGANALARRTIQRIAFPWLPLGPAPVVPAAVFSDPEVAYVGPPLAELRKRYPADLIVTLNVGLNGTDRGYVMGLDDRSGFVTIHALRLSGRILSATVASPGAGEMIPLLTLALERRMRLYGVSRLVFPYPVLAEAIKKAADTFLYDTFQNLKTELTTYLRLRWRRPMAVAALDPEGSAPVRVPG
jgi:dihydrolipoamide dehydrogenase